MGEIYGKVSSRIYSCNIVGNIMYNYVLQGKACYNETTCYNLEPELTEILASTDTAEEVRRILWADWHNKLGQELRPLYIQVCANKQL